MVSGIIEKSYQVTALRFRPAKALLSSSDEGKDRSVAILDSILDATRTDLVHGLKTGAVESGTDTHLRQMLLGRVMMVLTPAQAASFMERFQALLEEMAQCAVSTLMQTTVAGDVLGRVGAALNTTIGAANLLSMACAGLLGALLGVRNVFVFAGIVSVVAGLLALRLFRQPGGEGVRGEGVTR